MAIHYRTQGIILKKADRGEANQLFTIYTKDFGKLDILGRAIRKIKSKLRTGAELFYFSELEFIQGKTYKTLTDAILIDKFRNLRKDLRKLKITYKISEVFNNLVSGQEPDKKIWQLLNEVLSKLNNCQIVKLSNCQLLYYFFLWNLFSILGYQPELYNCALCQKKMKPEKLFFNPKEGGVICFNCFIQLKSGKEITLETVKILRIILKKNWPILSKIKIEEDYLKFLNVISEIYYSYICHSYIRE